MDTAPTSDLESVIDSSRVGRFQIVIVAMCALVAMMDGFDTQSIAFVAPEIIRGWHVAPSAFGIVFGSGLFGGLMGAVIFGAAGDRFGRRRTLIPAMILIAAGSLTTPLAGSLNVLTGIRFVTGLGLGGVVPSFIALASEYVPRRVRATLVGLMFCGFPLGAVVGGLASAWLIPTFGWQSVFIAGGVMPLALLPVFVMFVPESVRFMAIKGHVAQVRVILRRLNSVAEWNDRVSETVHEVRSPTASLFAHGRAPGTLLLWLVFFLSLLMSYFLVNWIPVVARSSGMDLKSAVVAVATLNLGAVVGCIALGRLADRFGPAVTIGCAYLVGAIAIAAIGRAGDSTGLLYATTFLAGAFSIGAQMCTVALCAGFYETFLRATGIGWSIGVGRIGAIVGPVLGGILLGAGFAPPSLFIVISLTSMGAALAVFALGWWVLRPRAAREASEQTDAQPNLHRSIV
jgi:MFS transporter, AAHS family, 4-hydroxybenzoate transporter